ncbi:MAG: right-handed parallel beta-helix repeat-containing protein [Thaumarchaeota archaeon]|jgi:nucleoside phosphorylase|nr:right-handed parallel beta-helix repeat-containing protein [Nitrososphaerota archaeon]
MTHLSNKKIMSIVPVVLVITSFLIAGASVSFAQPGPPHSNQPVMIYVSPTGSNITGNGSTATPYSTIQYAVQVAPPHAVIIVEPGTYNEMVNITKTLTVESLSGIPGNTIINAMGQVFGILVQGHSASGTIISGLTIENAGSHGVFIVDSSNVIIEYNVLTHDGLNSTLTNIIPEDKAIELVGTSNSTVVDNIVINDLGGGIGVSDNGPINPGYIGSGMPSVAYDNVISGNSIINTIGGCGIVISSYNAGEGVIGNIVTNNKLVNDFSSIIVAADTPNTAAINNTVSYNTVLNTGEAGVVVHSNSPGDVVVNNAIIGNTISADGDPFSVPNIPIYTGILIGGEGPVPVINTTISSNMIDKETYGVAVINGIGTRVLSNNIFTTSVKIPVNNTAIVSTETVQNNARINSLNEVIASLSSQLSNLQSSVATSAQLNSLQSTVNSLKSSTVSNSQFNSLSGSLGTTTDVAYISLVLAIVLGIVAIALALRKK